MQTWATGCSRSRIRERVFDDQFLTETSQFFAEDTCETLLGTRTDTWNITYLEQVTTVFGQSAQTTFIELADSSVANLLIDSTLPPPPTILEPGLMFFDIWSNIDNQLVIGTCFDKRSDIECGQAGNVPDVLRYNSDTRFVLQ